jgi:hypothetical protein
MLLTRRQEQEIGSWFDEKTTCPPEAEWQLCRVNWSRVGVRHSFGKLVVTVPDRDATQEGRIHHRGLGAGPSGAKHYGCRPRLQDGLPYAPWGSWDHVRVQGLWFGSPRRDFLWHPGRWGLLEDINTAAFIKMKIFGPWIFWSEMTIASWESDFLQDLLSDLIFGAGWRIRTDPPIWASVSWLSTRSFSLLDSRTGWAPSWTIWGVCSRWAIADLHFTEHFVHRCVKQLQQNSAWMTCHPTIVSLFWTLQTLTPCKAWDGINAKELHLLNFKPKTAAIGALITNFAPPPTPKISATHFLLSAWPTVKRWSELLYVVDTTNLCLKIWRWSRGLCMQSCEYLARYLSEWTCTPLLLLDLNKNYNTPISFDSFTNGPIFTALDMLHAGKCREANRHSFSPHFSLPNFPWTQCS